MTLFQHQRPVRFQDIDAAGIAFFANVFGFFHDAYVEHLAARGIALSHVISAGTWGAPLVHAEADYKAPMRFGDTLTVAISGAQLGETSITVEYEIRNAATQRLCCLGKTVHAFIDRATFKPRPVPEEVRAAFSPA